MRNNSIGWVGGGGGVGGVGWFGPPTPGVHLPLPRPNFSSLLPPPLFPYFFFRYPRPKFRFFAPAPAHPTHLPPAPALFFVKSPDPPTPDPLTPGPPTHRPCYSSDTAIKTLTLQIQGQGHDQGKTPSYIWGAVFNRYVHFSICRNWIILVEIWQILYLTLKTKDQCHGQGQTWRSHLIPGYWYVCFFFRSNQTIFGWDKANSIFENSRPSSQRKSTEI